MEDDVFESMRQFAGTPRRIRTGGGNSFARPTVEEIAAVGQEAADRLGLRVPAIVLELRAAQFKVLCASASVTAMRKVRASRASQTTKRRLYGTKLRPEGAMA